MHPLIHLVGDMAMSPRRGETIVQTPPDWFAAPAAGLFAPEVPVLGNLECVPVQDFAGLSAARRMCLPDAVLDHFMALGVRHFNLANNHIRDGGDQGLQQALGALQARGLQHFGAGLTMAQAEAPLLLTLAGRRFAFLGACDARYAWCDAHGGGAAPLIEQRLLARVREARPDADHVVPILHAGLEFHELPEPPRMRLAQRLADAGASLIVFHHSHIVQPLARLGSVPVAWSLGNFAFPVVGSRYMGHVPLARRGSILDVAVQDDRLVVQLRLTGIDEEGRACPADAATPSLEQAQTMMTSPGQLRAAWHQMATGDVSHRLANSYWDARRHGIGAGLAALRRAWREPLFRQCLKGSLSLGWI